MNSYSIHTRMLQKTVLLFIFLFSLQTKAQSVIEWPRTDHLPVHAENHMYQDREGYMWYGTIDGLCRDDGYTIETFSSRSYPALANNYILHITEDTKGRLWLGTKNGVYLLDKRTYRMSPLPELEIKPSHTCLLLQTDVFTSGRKVFYYNILLMESYKKPSTFTKMATDA